MNRKHFSNYVGVSYIVLVVVCMISFIPLREMLGYKFVWSYETIRGFTGFIVLILSVLGTLLTRYVIVGRDELTLWMTFWLFVGLVIFFYLLFAFVDLIFTPKEYVFVPDIGDYF